MTSAEQIVDDIAYDSYRAFLAEYKLSGTYALAAAFRAGWEARSKVVTLSFDPQATG